jgi:glycosyltransferase involved in cell wall biosynthesis
MKINVAHIVEDLKTGGLERVIADIVSGLDTRVFVPRVWCLSRGGQIFDELKKKGIPVEILGMRSSRDPRFFLRLKAKLREENIHILHAHGYPGMTVGRGAGILARVPVMIGHMHSTYWDYTAKQCRIERWLSAYTAVIICCSRAVADFVTTHERIPAVKTAVIYNGIDSGKINKRDYRQKEQRLITCVASLFPHKGHRYLLEAAKIIVSRYCGGRVKFMMAGDGVLKDELMAYARELGIGDNVEFPGTINDLSAVMAQSDAVVLPSSEREGLGLALLEAMAAGVPVVGTSVGGIPEIIRDGENGLLVPPKDAPAMAQALIEIISDGKKAQEMGKKGQSMIESQFSLTGMLHKIETVYREQYEKIAKTTV